MRILLISTAALTVPPSTYGGQEQVLFDEAKELVKVGYKVSIASPIGSQVPKPIRHIPTIDLRYDVWNEAKAHEIIKSHIRNFDLIHDHSHAKLIYNYYEKKKRRNPALLSTLHCPTIPLFPTLEPNLVCVSKFHANWIKRRYALDAKYVRNGIDLDRFKYCKDKEDYFIFIGRPTPGKGTLDAIRFCKKLNAPIKVITGNVPTEQITDYWVEVARECWFLSKWEYLGEVSHEQKVDLLSRAKALLFPVQWEEPFGLTVIEALACGTPVIAYRHAAMPEIIRDGETGFLVKYRDKEGFMEAMKKVDDINPEDCRRDAEERWTSERMTKDYIALFEKVLNGDVW